MMDDNTPSADCKSSNPSQHTQSDNRACCFRSHSAPPPNLEASVKVNAPVDRSRQDAMHFLQSLVIVVILRSGGLATLSLGAGVSLITSFHRSLFPCLLIVILLHRTSPLPSAAYLESIQLQRLPQRLKATRLPRTPRQVLGPLRLLHDESWVLVSTMSCSSGNRRGPKRSLSTALCTMPGRLRKQQVQSDVTHRRSQS